MIPKAFLVAEVCSLFAAATRLYKGAIGIDLSMLNYFWDVVVELDPSIADLHEGRRFAEWNAEKLKTLCNDAGLTGIEIAPVEIETLFEDFDDYWQPFLGGQRPAGAHVAALGDPERAVLRETLKKRLPWSPDGSIALRARAWGGKGQA